MTENNSIMDILEQHARYVENEIDGKRLIWAELTEQQKADLYKVNLTGIDLCYANLAGADLRCMNLMRARLRNANLQGIFAFATEFSYCDLCGADLRDAYLKESHFVCASFVNADLKGADLQDTNVSWANFEGANLENANLHHIIVQGTQWGKHPENAKVEYLASMGMTSYYMTPPESRGI